jgi:hypothetical protein
MKYLIFAMALLWSSLSFADDNATVSDLQKRVQALESKQGPEISKDLYIKGQIQSIYDDKTYNSGLHTTGQVQVGASHNVENGNSYFNWIGASAVYDTYHELDHTQDNTFTAKQLGFGGDYYRLALGETDMQRIGFAKTAKVGIPLIITTHNSRIDQNEKVVLAVGGFQWDDKFDYNEYRLKKDFPIGAMIGYDKDTHTQYRSVTANVKYFDLSYMQIATPNSQAEDNVTDYSGKKKNQEGYSIGGPLFQYGIPVFWGAEMWNNHNTGYYSVKQNRYDYEVFYMINKEWFTSFHRTEHDDLGYTGNYYALVREFYTNPADVNKRPDQRRGAEVGAYLYDQTQRNPYTNAYVKDGQQIVLSASYKF